MDTAQSLSEKAKQLYRGNRSLSALLQVFRPYICPFEEILPLVPQGAKVLDAGCGAGLFLGLLGMHDRIAYGLGFDSNDAAIAVAKHMASNVPHGASLEFKQIDATAAWPEGEFDVVSLIDVLHHVPPPVQYKVLSLAISKVRPGGVLLYKDMAVRPRWRAWSNQLHDLLLARQWIHHVPIARVEQHLLSAGMSRIAGGSAARYCYAHEWSVFRRLPI